MTAYRGAPLAHDFDPEASANYPQQMRVIRWGRSAVETDDDVAHEADVARALGFDWSILSASASPQGADVLLVHSGQRVQSDTLMNMRPKSWVLTTTSGVDHIDLEAARESEVRVARCPLARRDPVVGWTLCALEALLRRQPALDRAARSGRWARADLPGLGPRTLSDSTVVVVGLGVIGWTVASRLQQLGARVRGVDPNVVGFGNYALSDAVADADAMTLHCALGRASHNLIDGRVLDKLPRHAVLVNTARGDVLDLNAATERLDRGQLGGLAVDVFPQEPWPHLSDLAARGVWTTPHAAGFVHDLGRRVRNEVAGALAAIAAHQDPPHEVIRG